MNLIQFEGCTVAVIAPEDLEAQEAEITALRAEVRALRGFAHEVIEEIYGEGLVKQIANAHGLFDALGRPTPLLTGEPGPGVSMANEDLIRRLCEAIQRGS